MKLESQKVTVQKSKEEIFNVLSKTEKFKEIMQHSISNVTKKHTSF